jgi:hypothetical protein
LEWFNHQRILSEEKEIMETWPSMKELEEHQRVWKRMTKMKTLEASHSIPPLIAQLIMARREVMDLILIQMKIRKITS